MKVALAILAVFLNSIVFGQDLAACRQAIADPQYQVPASLAFGSRGFYQARSLVFLFSLDGLDFYGAERSKYLGGEPRDENGAWIIGVFRDENIRRAEIPQLMMRLSNPNLAIDYASGVKYMVAFVELGMDRDSEPFKAWMRCNQKTSSQEKCPVPRDVPMVSEVDYYQPNQCIRPSVPGLLFSDSNPKTAYPRATYTSPALPISLQKDLSQAAGQMLERFKNEDAIRTGK
jgi:hypothetical protein